MKKFILTGTDNNGFRHRYSVKKLEEFKPAFFKFMKDLGFDEQKIKNSFLVYFENEKEVELARELKIEEITDECWNYNNKKFDVDIFFGKFKIILVIRTKNRVPMVEHLEKKAGWVKSLEIKKIKEEKIKNKIPVPSPKFKNKSK